MALEEHVAALRSAIEQAELVLHGFRRVVETTVTSVTEARHRLEGKKGKPVSRQVALQKRRIADGLCAQCGTRKIDPKSKRYCRPCLDMFRERMSAKGKAE